MPFLLNQLLAGKKDIYLPATKLAMPISTGQEYNPSSKGSTTKHLTYLLLKYKPTTLTTNTRQQAITELTQWNGQSRLLKPPHFYSKWR